MQCSFTKMTHSHLSEQYENNEYHHSVSRKSKKTTNHYIIPYIQLASQKIPKLNKSIIKQNQHIITSFETSKERLVGDKYVNFKTYINTTNINFINKTIFNHFQTSLNNTGKYGRGGSNSIAKYCNTFGILQYLLLYFEILQ